jgi:type I restriction enzyme M protein
LQVATMTVTNDIVQKLWGLCNVLRDDGVTYLQYVTELTYLLFLKMMQETDQETVLPEGNRWADLVSYGNEKELVAFYKAMLLHLGTKSENQRVKQIFDNAQTSLKRPTNLRTLISNIDSLDWYSAKEEGLGDLYEGLLEKNASEKKSGAGQYFTPRVLIDAIVRVMRPEAGEVIQDPAAGTGGFLIAADRLIRQQTHGFGTLSLAQQNFQRVAAFEGIELVQDAHRLLLMNLLLHGIESPVGLGDALGSEGERLAKADLILSNPPFGTKKGGGAPTRQDFTFDTSNKQLAFLQHIYRGLKPGGRAAVVLPDNVLFEGNVGRQIRVDLMEKCNLHTILRLPTGIFYAQGVKTNVLFFTRGLTDEANTKEVWVFDLRSNMPQFGKRTKLGPEHFAEFEADWATDAQGTDLSKRVDMGEAGRWRRFGRQAIADRADSLDISWLRDENEERSEDLPEPEVLAREAVTELKGAIEELQGILAELAIG